MSLDKATESQWEAASRYALNNSKQNKVQSDGSTASYYECPVAALDLNKKLAQIGLTEAQIESVNDLKFELQSLISYKNMNAQMGEIFRSTFRYGEVAHSKKERDCKKIVFYAEAEQTRLSKYGDE